MKIHKRFFYITLASIFVFQLLMSLQGFDVCDSGFYATTYANIIDAPDSVEYNFMYYFSSLLGGVFFKLLPSAGILGLRILGVVILTASYWMVYKILYRYVDTKILCLSFVFIAMSCWIYEMAHNMLTTLLFLGAVWAMLSGLRKNKLSLIALSGVIFVLESFTRLPNFLHPFFAVIIIINAIYYKERPTVWLSRIAVFVGAYIVVFVGFIMMMRALGHTDNFLRAIDIVRAMGNNQEETHGIVNLIRSNIFAYIKVAKVTLILCVYLFGGAYLLSLSKLSKGVVSYIAMFVVVLAAFFAYNKMQMIEVIYAISLLPIIVALIVFKKDKELSVVCWSALFMVLVLPIGSDAVIYNFGQSSIWLSFGLGMGFIWLLVKENVVVTINGFIVTILSQKLRKTAIIMVVVMLIFMFKRLIFNGTYFEPTTRFKQTCQIDNPKTKGIYTTKERAEIINTILKEIKPYVKPGDYLFCYESFPMLHYLTETKPYIYMSWPMIYSGSMLKQQVERAEREIPELPVVVRLKFSTLGIFSEPDEHLLDDNREVSMFSSKGETNVYNDFLRRNRYTAVWSNEYFDIMLPQANN